MDLTEYEELGVRRTKACVYGPPKSGKTALLGKLAEAGFTLHHCDLENGVKTLLNPAILKPEFRKNVKVINIPDHRTNPVAIVTMASILKGGKHRICYNHGTNNCPICQKIAEAKWSHEFNIAEFGDKDVLVIDSMTQLALSAMNKVTYKMITAPNGDDYKYEFDDYRMQAAKMEGVLSRIQVSNINVFVISHDTDTSPLENGKKFERIVPQAGTRNFSRTSAKYFDEVVYCKVVNGKHKFYSDTDYSNTVLTGGRTGLDLSKGEFDIVDMFNGNYKARQAKQAQKGTINEQRAAKRPSPESQPEGGTSADSPADRDAGS